MYSSRCESTNTNKHISHQPIIVNHTFVSAVFSPVLTEYSLSDILYLKP